MKMDKFYQDFTKQNKTKLCDVLNKKPNGGKALLLFLHGLGDTVEFLPLFNTVQKMFPKWQLKVGYHPTQGFEGLHPDIIPIKDINPDAIIPFGMSIVQIPHVFQFFDLMKLDKEYDYIFNIHFYDYRDRQHPELNKHVKHKTKMCQVLEFGLPEKLELTPYKIIIPDNIVKNEKQVVFGYGGETDKIKIPDIKIQEQIWNEIKEAGFEPFDCHVNARVNCINSKQPIPEWISEDKTLRNTNSTSKDLINLIASSKYFVGVTSGPLHLASKVLGGDKCICTEKFFKVKDYYSEHETINIIDGNEYVNGSVKDLLLKLENN